MSFEEIKKQLKLLFQNSPEALATDHKNMPQIFMSLDGHLSAFYKNTAPQEP